MGITVKKLEDQLTPGRTIITITNQPEQLVILQLPSGTRLVIRGTGEQHIVKDGDVEFIRNAGWIAPLPAKDVPLPFVRRARGSDEKTEKTD
jgi:hypothetical protein